MGPIPVFGSEGPYDILDDLPDPPQLIDKTQLATVSDIYAHGYAMITFDGAGAKVDYFQEPDFTKPFYSEPLAAAAAGG
jgi:hypothetical protein